MPNSEPASLPRGGIEDQARLGGDTSGMSQLKDLAFRLAKSHVISRHPRPRPSLMDHLREREVLLRDAYEHFRQISEAQRALPYAAEWLLDNFYTSELYHFGNILCE